MKYEESLANCKDNMKKINELFDKVTNINEFNDFDENKHEMYTQFIELFSNLKQFDRLSVNKYFNE